MPNALESLLEFYFNPRGYQQRQERQRQEQARRVYQVPQGSLPAGGSVAGPQGPDLMTAVRRNQAETNPQIRAEVDALLGPLSRQHREAIAAGERDIASAEARQREAQTLIASAGARPAPVPSYGASPGAMGAVIPPRNPAPAPVQAASGPPPISDEITVQGQRWNMYPELQRSGGAFQPVGPAPRPQVQPIQPAPQQLPTSAVNLTQAPPPVAPRQPAAPMGARPIVNAGPFITMPPANPADVFIPSRPPNALSPQDRGGYIPPTATLPASGGGRAAFPFAQGLRPNVQTGDVYPPAPEGFGQGGPLQPAAQTLPTSPLPATPPPAPPPVRSTPNPPPVQIPASAAAQLPAPVPQLGQNMPPDIKAQLIAELQRLSLERIKAQQGAGTNASGQIRPQEVAR